MLKENVANTTVQLSDIAAKTGFSLSTVSKVLNGRSDVSERTRQTITEAIETYGYHRRVRSSKNRKLIEVVFQKFDSLWCLEILRGILTEAQAHGLSVITTESGDETHPDSSWVNGVIHRQPLVVILIFSNLTVKETRLLHSYNINYLTLDPSGTPSPDNMSVQADNWTGGVIATRHLLDLGHKRIGIITGPNQMMCSRARFDGYKAALNEHGIPLDRKLVREGDFTTQCGYREALSLLKEPNPPTAIFGGCDLQSMGVYEAARRMRIRIPEDLSVVGFDDIQTSAFMGPAMTTVHQPLQEMAVMATNMLIDKEKGTITNNQVVLPTSLKVRNSTAPVDA